MWDYSVPYTQVGQTLSVLADPHQVRIVLGATVLATHTRSYDQGAQIEDPAHIEALRATKSAARGHSGTDRLRHVAPTSQAFLTAIAERGEPLGRVVHALEDLLERYGATALEAALKDTLARGVPHPQAVQRALEEERGRLHQPPPLAPIPPHIKARDVVVRQATLAPYDALSRSSDPAPGEDTTTHDTVNGAVPESDHE